MTSMKFSLLFYLLIIIKIREIQAWGKHETTSEGNENKLSDTTKCQDLNATEEPFDFVLKTNKQLFSNSDNNFHYIIFIQHWPQTTCYSLVQEQQQFQECFLPEKDAWTIAGIWPSRYRTFTKNSIPINCDLDWKFDANQLETIKQELYSKWADVIINNNEPNSLWQAEWEKYGTCLAGLKNEDAIKNYFRLGLKLIKDFDMKSILKKSNILPGKSYLLEDYINGIRHNLGVVAQIQCIQNQKTKEWYLHEIRLYFKKDLTPVSAGDFGNCPPNEPIHYASINFNDINIFLYNNTLPNLVNFNVFY